MINAQIQAVLAARGRTGQALVDYLLVDNSDGKGPQIQYWDTVKLGPFPTEDQLAAVTSEMLTTTVRLRRNAELESDVRFRALRKAIHQRLRAAGVDQMTMAEWKALLDTAYDEEKV